VGLDRFKAVNDSYGHETGDEVLIEVARRFDGALRQGDTIARFGGDEFVILCEGLQDETEAWFVAERLQHRLLASFKLSGGSEHFVTSSAGVALGRAAGTDADALLREADAAMYRAKDLGGARYEVFDEALRDRLLAHLRTEDALGRPRPW
jgi:diguanylate cyclase (GGDEF)-like protein